MTTSELVVPVNKGVSAMTAEELGVQTTGMQVEVPSDVQDKANMWIEAYKARLGGQVEAYLARQSATNGAAPQPQAGEPVHVGYPYGDLLSISPSQFIGLPPYLPNRIIASGEVGLLLSVLFINPATNVNNPISATTILGGRGFRIRFEQINLTDVTNGPDFTFVGTFPSPAPVISIFPVFFVAPNPGANPRLMEVNVTADITDLAQPFAAFATHHLDIDSEPGFLNVPPVGPELQHDIPLRYLIYAK